MKQRFTDDEMRFIKEVLEQHGEYLTKLLKEDVRTKRLIRSKALQDSLKTAIASQGDNPKLSADFFGYGRAIEIRGGKKSLNTTQLMLGSRNRQTLGKKPKKKNTQWYSKNVYGSLNRLIGILMYEYSEKVSESIKDSLQNTA